ncbi:MAG: class I SAM-dependent methyltransferase [Armatimonadetes bacterium]|nr:class I SAM-dependent methyltransferase [Armatimonadota bacterium]
MNTVLSAQQSSSEPAPFAIEFQHVCECYVCAGTETEAAFERSFFGRIFSWVRCRGCGMVYQQPKIRRSSLHQIYNSDTYWKLGSSSSQGQRVGYDNYVLGEPYRLAQARQRARFLARRIPPGGSVLDLGSAAGYSLKALQELGLRSRGIELSEEMVRFGRERFDIELEAGDFDELSMESDSWDAVTAWGCDSNFFDPRATFQNIRRILKPGGVFVFNFFDFDHWAKPLLGEFKLVYNAIYYFNRENCDRLLRSVGLEPTYRAMEFQYTCLDEIFLMTNRQWLRRLVTSMNVHRSLIRLPILGSYVVVARKPG